MLTAKKKKKKSSYSSQPTPPPPPLKRSPIQRVILYPSCQFICTYFIQSPSKLSLKKNKLCREKFSGTVPSLGRVQAYGAKLPTAQIWCSLNFAGPNWSSAQNCHSVAKNWTNLRPAKQYTCDRLVPLWKIWGHRGDLTNPCTPHDCHAFGVRHTSWTIRKLQTDRSFLNKTDTYNLEATLTQAPSASTYREHCLGGI